MASVSGSELVQTDEAPAHTVRRATRIMGFIAGRREPARSMDANKVFL